VAGTLKLIWFQPPCHEQGPLPPAQGAQSSIQRGLEPCQGGGSHSFSGQLGQGLTTLMVKNFFLISNLNLPSVSLQPLVQFKGNKATVKADHDCPDPMPSVDVAPLQPALCMGLGNPCRP